MDRLKSWIVGKTHRLLGVGQIHEQLRQTNELLRNLNVTLSLRDGGLPRAASAEGSLSPGDSLRRLATGGLFVVGCARSGTTILTKCLNRAEEIMLLEEPYFFLHEDVADFASFFNDRQASMGSRRLKGTFVPPPVAPEFGPLGLLCRLRQDYRYVGEKVAVGPHDFPPNWRQAYLDFQSKYFLHARYVFIMRTPVESLWSMHKMFPDCPVPRLFEAWLGAAALSLDAYQLFPKSRVVFFDDLSPATIDRLADWLEVAIPLTPGTLGDGYIHSSLAPGEIPEPLLAFEALCSQCTELYEELRASFSKDELVYDGGANQWSCFYGFLRRIEELLQAIQAPRAGEAVSEIKQFVLPAPRSRIATAASPPASSHRRSSRKSRGR